MSDEPEIWYDVPDDTPYPESEVIERLTVRDEAAIRADERERIKTEWKSEAKDQRSWLAMFEREVRADERAKIVKPLRELADEMQDLLYHGAVISSDYGNAAERIRDILYALPGDEWVPTTEGEKK